MLTILSRLFDGDIQLIVPHGADYRGVFSMTPIANQSAVDGARPLQHISSEVAVKCHNWQMD